MTASLLFVTEYIRTANFVFILLWWSFLISRPWQQALAQRLPLLHVMRVALLRAPVANLLRDSSF
ncbi:hypothetical protein THIX_60162 [Thiomonas sp. X19]|nr:hypothetical protein THIX_60162 [Thiomonas sp. X19]